MGIKINNRLCQHFYEVVHGILHSRGGRIDVAQIDSTKKYFPLCHLFAKDDKCFDKLIQKLQIQLFHPLSQLDTVDLPLFI